MGTPAEQLSSTAVMGPLIFMALTVVGAYFLIIRPQQARVRSHNDLVASVAVGDEIVTAGGIVGTITAVTERDIMLLVAPQVELKIAKGAIMQKAPDSEVAQAESTK